MTLVDFLSPQQFDESTLRKHIDCDALAMIEIAVLVSSHRPSDCIPRNVALLPDYGSLKYRVEPVARTRLLGRLRLMKLQYTFITRFIAQRRPNVLLSFPKIRRY